MTRHDYRYSRAAVRSLLFSWLGGSIPDGPCRRFERAWRQSPDWVRTILLQHRGGPSAVTDWVLEGLAVDELAGVLRRADDRRREWKAAA